MRSLRFAFRFRRFGNLLHRKPQSFVHRLVTPDAPGFLDAGEVHHRIDKPQGLGERV